MNLFLNLYLKYFVTFEPLAATMCQYYDVCLVCVIAVTGLHLQYKDNMTTCSYPLDDTFIPCSNVGTCDECDKLR